MSRVYEYKCRLCQTQYELADHDTKQRCCGVRVKRIFSFGGVVFKGSGFYKTDSRKNND